MLSSLLSAHAECLCVCSCEKWKVLDHVLVGRFPAREALSLSPSPPPPSLEVNLVITVDTRPASVDHVISSRGAATAL